ncbi:VanZ family protein [Zavarzinella formosa]|uniref:VanZ family protein n=1 Tax=Zavarzinella formosa TaxID=360055 RepID=UPI000374B5E4|nr:VanZ family protein [Zavarzinella formosa]
MTTRPLSSPPWLRWAHLLVFVAFFTAWTIALLSPVPKESAKEILGDEDNIFYFGKLLHVAAYAWLAVLGGTIWLMRTRWSWIVVLLIVHGELTEYFQQFVGRTSSVRDTLLDSTGVLIGALLVRFWWRFKSSKSSLDSATPSTASPA